jgi:hypothetical protein
MTAGPFSQPGYKGCGWRFSIGPAGDVEHHALLLGLKAIVTGYGGEGAEEQVASVGHDGGAAGSDFVSGLELIEFAEGVVDVGGGAIAESYDRGCCCRDNPIHDDAPGLGGPRWSWHAGLTALGVEGQSAKPGVSIHWLGRKEIGKFLSAVAAINPPGDEVEKANLGKIRIKDEFRVRPHGRGGSGKRDGEERKSGGREGARRTSAN